MRRERAVDQRSDLLVADPPRRARPGFVEQAVRAQPGEALAPFADGMLGDTQFRGDGGVAPPCGGMQDNASPQRQSLRRLAASRPRFQLGAFRLVQLQGRRYAIGHRLLRISPSLCHKFLELDTRATGRYCPRRRKQLGESAYLNSRSEHLWNP